MDLWIRSQDRENLIPIKKPVCIYNTTIAYKESAPYIIKIAEYKTKERALEVLDEIQDELIGSDFMPIEKDEEVVLTCGSARIYEMPEE